MKVAKCRVLLIALLLMAVPTVFLAQQVPHPPAQPRPSQSEEPATTFKVNVRLVNVFTIVTDESGAPVGNLTKEDFHVFEDGKEQDIAVFARESELPLSIVLAVDASLSTRKDLPLELESARRFAHVILRPVDAISIYQFSQFVSEVIPFTGDLRVIDRGIARIQSQSSTALYDAIYLGSRALIPREGRKVLVVITDGGDTSSKVSYSEAVRAAQTAEAIVYSIIMVPIEASAGRDIGGEHALIQISHDTGGKYYYASDLNGLDKAFKQISEELRTQYLVAYYPARRIGGDFRKIQVVVEPQASEKISAAKLRVRHRTGYYNSKLE
jgi:Ca-activated chloride channel family protein